MNNRNSGFLSLSTQVFCAVMIALSCISATPLLAPPEWSTVWLIARDVQSPSDNLDATTNVWISPSCRELGPGNRVVRMLNVLSDVTFKDIPLGRCTDSRSVIVDSTRAVELRVSPIDKSIAETIAAIALGDSSLASLRGSNETPLAYRLIVSPRGSLTWGQIVNKTDLNIQVEFIPQG